ncbi:MFS transporter [Candidatus Bathyarchaeota archaeon]|nr:MFS transporter [Candidatus Bathyarchaeota archaeon]
MMFKKYPLSFFILCIVALVTMFSTSLINPLLSIFAQQVGGSGIQIGLVVAGYWMSRILLEIPSGVISARYGYYLPMVIGLVLTTVGIFLNALAVDPFQLLLTRILQGFGAPLFFAISMTFVTQLFDAKNRGSAMGLFQGIEFVGTIIGSSFSGYIIATLDFRMSLILCSILSGLGLIILLFAPNVRRHELRTASTSLSLSQLREVFKSRNLLIVSAATFSEFLMTNGILFTIFPIYAKETLGFTLQSIGLIMGARSLGFVISMFAMGTVADRIGRKPVLVFGVVFTGLLTLLIGFATSFELLTLIIFCSGISTGAIWVISPVVAAESVEPSYRGTAIGVYRTFFDLGSIVGPIVMTIIQESLGMLACFISASLFLLANIPSTLKMVEKD